MSSKSYSIALTDEVGGGTTKEGLSEAVALVAALDLGDGPEDLILPHATVVILRRVRIPDKSNQKTR